jgi:peptide/nickel transport system permease protein
VVTSRCSQYVRLLSSKPSPRDYTLTSARHAVAAVFIVVNFLVDLAYAWIDPRIRFR